ncbi:MAG: hypothetical protein IJ812_02170 [Schwartzia sp.]|nr:hypothetical protein [Schwartzia sp. (in: firmicutes)]MBR1885191.1 hypothetical protein [Schwartzia sp. (in: firmicutes)]
MNGKKIIAAALGALLFCTGPAAALLPEAYAAARKTANPKKEKKEPTRQKGGQPEILTYERAMEIENKRHANRLEAIRKFYRLHRPKRRLATQKENEFHAKRVQEIKEKYGMA